MYWSLTWWALLPRPIFFHGDLLQIYVFIDVKTCWNPLKLSIWKSTGQFHILQDHILLANLTGWPNAVRRRHKLHQLRLILNVVSYIIFGNIESYLKSSFSSSSDSGSDTFAVSDLSFAPIQAFHSFSRIWNYDLDRK